MIALTLAWTAAAADVDALLAADGWEALHTAKADVVGEIALEARELGDDRCLRGTATVAAPPAVLYDVVTDMEAADRITREKLLASRTLGRDGATLEYYQHLEVPDWTMVADRYWVLRGERQDRDGAILFVWDRFDWRGKYPELAASLASDHPDAIEPEPNFGVWRFAPSGAGSTATYALCTHPGGSIPEWLVRVAATKTFPNTMADVFAEAVKRAGG